MVHAGSRGGSAHTRGALSRADVANRTGAPGSVRRAASWVRGGAVAACCRVTGCLGAGAGARARGSCPHARGPRPAHHLSRDRAERSRHRPRRPVRCEPMIEAHGLVKRYASTVAVNDLLLVAVVYAIARTLLDRRDA